MKSTRQNERVIYTRQDFLQFYFSKEADSDPFPLNDIDFEKFENILQTEPRTPINTVDNNFRYTKDDKINPFRGNMRMVNRRNNVPNTQFKSPPQPSPSKSKKSSDDVPEWADVNIEDIQQELDAEVEESTMFMYIANGRTEGPVKLSQLQEWCDLGVLEGSTSIKRSDQLEYSSLSHVLEILRQNQEKKKLMSNNPLLSEIPKVSEESTNLQNEPAEQRSPIRPSPPRSSIPDERKMYHHEFMAQQSFHQPPPPSNNVSNAHMQHPGYPPHLAHNQYPPQMMGPPQFMQHPPNSWVPQGQWLQHGPNNIHPFFGQNGPLPNQRIPNQQPPQTSQPIRELNKYSPETKRSHDEVQRHNHPFNVPTHFSLQPVNASDLEKVLMSENSAQDSPTSSQVRQVVEQQKKSPIKEQNKMEQENREPAENSSPTISPVQSSNEFLKPKPQKAWGNVPQPGEILDLKQIAKEEAKLSQKQREEQLKVQNMREKKRSWGNVQPSKGPNIQDIQKIQASEAKNQKKKDQPTGLTYSDRLAGKSAWGGSSQMSIGNLSINPSVQKEQPKKSPNMKTMKPETKEVVPNAWGTINTAETQPPQENEPQSVWSFSSKPVQTAPAVVVPKKKSKKKKGPKTYASISSHPNQLQPKPKASSEDFPTLGTNPLAQRPISKEFREWYTNECERMGKKNLANANLLTFLMNIEKEEDLNNYILKYFGVDAQPFARSFISNRFGSKTTPFQTQKKKKRRHKN